MNSGGWNMSYKLIIVDDEKEISSGFAQFFPWGSLGFEVTAQFADAQKAFDYLKKNPVDVVVSDIIMPGMTGLELAKMISETELLIQPHVILFSAYDNFEFARKALRYKCTEYILKSSEYDELIEIFTHLKQTMDQERGSGTSGSDAGEEVLLPVSVCNDKIISAIINYITKEPATADLEGAAAAVYMSTAYISRYFKQKTGFKHVGPPGIGIYGLGIFITEGINKAALQQLCHLIPFIDGKARILGIRFGILEVNFLMCHIQIPAYHHRLLLIQIKKELSEILLPFHAVIQSCQLSLGIRGVYGNQIEILIFRSNNSALAVMLRDSHIKGYADGLLL
jgi:two-component system response regulator YesN